MAGSSAPLRRLGAELRRLREATGRTQSDVGEAIGRTHTSLVNWERGKTKISKADLAYLLAELRAPVEVRKTLERLRDESGRGAGHWNIYGLPDWLKPLVGFEEEAVKVTNVEVIVIPGLLQTEDYARAIHMEGRYTFPGANLDKLVAARMQRQQRLRGAQRLTLHAVIAEAAFRLEVGGPSVMAAQLEHILTASQKSNVAVHVLPTTTGAHPALAGGFVVLHFADPKIDPPLGYIDGPIGGYLVSDEGDVAAMIKVFDDVRHMAMNRTDSLALLTAIMEEYRKKKARTHV